MYLRGLDFSTAPETSTEGSTKARVTRIHFQIDPLWIVYSNIFVFIIVFIVSVWTGRGNVTIFDVARHACFILK